MEKMIIYSDEIQNNLKKYTLQLNELISSESIKYSSWPGDNKTILSNSAGIYHFYEKTNKIITSLYVGKAGFGNSSWNLYKRINQHFQTSQKNTLLGKMSKAQDQSPDITKRSLFEREVYLQWIVLFSDKNNTKKTDEEELIWLECFCKSILKPIYTNA